MSVRRSTPARLSALVAAVACSVVGLTGGASRAATPSPRPATVKVVEVGTVGNEPLIAAAPDGTLYVAALQYLYRSQDKGAHWQPIRLPPESGLTEYKTDSSISVDPGGRLYYAFDYPYAGTTAVCTSDDRGESWACDPATIPGGTDRMWVTAANRTEAFVVTNEALYQPILAHTADRGKTWTPQQVGGSGVNAYTGRPVALASGPVFQPVNAGSLKVNVYNRGLGGSYSSATVDTGLPASNTGPSAAITPDATLYVASEAVNDAQGRGVVVARSTDHAAHWTRLPPLPGSASGTAIFTAVTSGKNGHVGVLYYWSPTSKDPSLMPATAQWYAVYVDSQDAASAHPHWRLTRLEKIGHIGTICRGLGCDLNTGSVPPRHTSDRFAGDFLGAAIGPDGAANLTWMGHDRPASSLPVDPSSNYGDIHFARLR